MKVSVKEIAGIWDEGYVLDKHVLSSICTGQNEYGHPTFDTTRSEAGEALYKLKYRNDWTQAAVLAEALAKVIYPRFSRVGLIIPMPPSKSRPRQPVAALAEAFGGIVQVPVFDRLLVKAPSDKQLKDMTTKDEKLETLKNCFKIEDQIEGSGSWNALLVDDLFDTGATVEAACIALRTYPKIDRIYVAALTWK